MSGQTQEKKRVTPRNLLNAVLIVITIQLLAILITYQNLPVLIQLVSDGGNSFSPAGTSPAGSVGNAVILVLLAFGATLALVLLLKRRRVFPFKLLIFASTSLSAFILTLVTADSFVFGNVSTNLELPIDMGIAFIPVALIAYTVFGKNHPVVSTMILAFVGAEVGSFFASTLDLGTAIALPIAFSIYDVFAVFRGPLKQLVGTAPGVALNGMSIKLGEFTLGLGDVVFYTMLPSLAYFHTLTPPMLAISAPFATILAIDVGVVLTLVLLTKKRLLPGLPIPMLLGVLVLVGYLL